MKLPWLMQDHTSETTTNFQRQKLLSFCKLQTDAGRLQETTQEDGIHHPPLRPPPVQNDTQDVEQKTTGGTTNTTPGKTPTILVLHQSVFNAASLVM